MEALSSDTKRRLQRVDDLMLEIYQTRAEMRYIDAAAIKAGPQDITHLIPFYQSLKNYRHFIDPLQPDAMTKPEGVVLVHRCVEICARHNTTWRWPWATRTRTGAAEGRDR
ncbi:hypothetical protein PG994_012583 [Apiospora phragmitis]|uniref:Uncharacterized protein n=1 Tax=Apiospora phragmitis TaxID=2905665 RepID=A0ABR1TCP2_9PEZI